MTNAFHQKIRPLKIDNNDLLDPYFHVPVLRKEAQEGTHYQLVSSSVWNQLQQWYGGGPQIDRPVVSVDKNVRLKLLQIQCKLLLLESQALEQERNKGKSRSNKSGVNVLEASMLERNKKETKVNLEVIRVV